MVAWHCGHVLWPILMHFDRIWSGGQYLHAIYCQVVNKNSCYLHYKGITEGSLRPLILRPPGIWCFLGYIMMVRHAWRGYWADCGIWPWIVLHTCFFCWYHGEIKTCRGQMSVGAKCLRGPNLWWPKRGPIICGDQLSVGTKCTGTKN